MASFLRRRHGLPTLLSLLLWGMCLTALPRAGAQPVSWTADFEDGRTPDLDPNLSCPENVEAAIVPREGSGGRCLRIATTSPSAYCQLNLVTPVAIRRNLVLEFDHREEIEEGYEGAYLGIIFSGEDGKQIFWESDTFSGEWRRKTVVIPLVKPSFGVDPEAGLVIERIQLYGRVKDQGARGATACRMTVWFDNIRVHSPDILAPASVSDTYVCHNNPPLLDWQEPTRGGQRLQLSPDVAFAPETTQTMVLKDDRPFLLADAPLAPGQWYFRVEAESPLLRGWSTVQSVRLPERTHNYHLADLSFEPLRGAPRPRLLPRIRPEGDPLSEGERSALLAGVRQAMSQDVPDHPGPYQEGDPRWPQWIDWYGSVADKITSRTGGRLKRVGAVAIQTADAEARAAAKRLLLQACQWDPDGGSAARYGDLQAASLLQGMLWCYDACADDLAAAERELAESMIHTRTMQFVTHLSPFRMNPAQNHPWKKTAVVTEAALVMMGVFPEAEAWLDLACHAFAYRILPSMGFEGENQEGIAYWSYGVSMLANIADLLRTMAGVDVYDHPWLARTCRFPIVCAPPGGYAVSFADNSSQGNASIVGPYGTALTGLLGKRTADPYALWYADQATAAVDPKPPADLPQSVFYPHIGYVLFNTCLSDGLENVAVAMRSGPYYAGHQHDDNNGFVIHAYGDKLAVDGGYYDWYGSPHFKAYSIRTVAHNTLLVNGKGQKRATDGAILDSFDSPGFGWSVGDASNPEIYEGRLKRFERRLLFLKPGFVIVHDLVETSGEPAALDWLLHAHTETPFPVDEQARTFRIARPRATLDGTFLAPRDLRLKVTKSFDIAPQKPRESVFLPWDEVQPEWTLTAAPPDPVAATEFLAVMAVRRGQDDPAVTPTPIRRLETVNALGCDLRTDYGRYVVLLRKRRGQGPLRTESLMTDGDALVVFYDAADALANAMAVRASQVRVGDALLLDRDSPRNWSLDQQQGPETIAIRGSLDAEDFPVQGRRFALPDGPLAVYWSTLPAGKRRRSAVVIEGWTGDDPPRVRVGHRTFEGTQGQIAWGPDKACITVTGRGEFEALRLTSKQYRVLDSRKLDAAFKPGESDILIETDEPVAQSRRKGKVMDKVGATGGTAFCMIDGPVQWAEWTFSVPRTATYEFYIRAASIYPSILREFSIDAQPFPEKGAAVRMAGTGGWCRTSDDWAWFGVNDSQARPATVTLQAGDHRLRLDYVDSSQNIDCFLLRPVNAATP